MGCAGLHPVQFWVPAKGDFTLFTVPMFDDLCHNFITLILNHFLSLQLVSVAAHPITVHLQNEPVSCLFQNLTLGLVLQPLAESTGFT